MKRVLVLGTGGSGKSTFARRLGEILNIKVIHLDMLFWKAGWVETPDDEWNDVVAGLLKDDQWIIDGNYSRTRSMRLAASDTVIFLDMPRYQCIYRILKRAIVYRNRTRPDMAPNCTERMTWEFFMWVWNYPMLKRPQITKELANTIDNQIIILRSSKEVAKFLDALEKQ